MTHGVVTTGIDPDDILRALEPAKDGRLKLLDGDGIIRPVGLGVDDMKNVLTIARMRDMVGGRSRQIIPVHEQRLAETFPSRTSAHGLNVTEVHRRGDDPSYVS